MNDDRHLTTDEMLLAVVDRSDLPEARRNHLLQCRSCQAAVAAAAGTFESLGAAARAQVPPPRSLPRLPAAKPVPFRIFGRQAVRGWGLALVFLLALVFYLETPDGIVPVPKSPVRVSEIANDNGRWMTEVALLVENALPREYIDMAESEDPLPDEGFMEFLVPLPKTETISEKLLIKGAVT